MPTKATRTVARRTIAALGCLLLTVAMSACSPWQAKQWGKWHERDPQAAQEFLDAGCPGVNNGCEITRPAQAEAPAVRIQSTGGSSASTGNRCTGYEDMLAAYSPGWDVVRMSQIMYRESRCNPGAYNPSGATGLLQILKSHCAWLAPRVGPCNLTNPSYNIRAAAELFRNGGYQHWALTR